MDNEKETWEEYWRRDFYKVTPLVIISCTTILIVFIVEALKNWH